MIYIYMYVFVLVYILYPDTPSFTNIRMLVSIFWNLQPRIEKSSSSDWSFWVHEVNPILSPDPNLFILQSYLPNVPEIHSLGTSDLEQQKHRAGICFFFFWVLLLFFWEDADLLIEFPMIQEGSDWRDVVVFVAHVLVQDLMCFFVLVNLVVWNPLTGESWHPTPSQTTTNITLFLKQWHVKYIDFAFLLRVNVENFSVEVRFVLDSAGWCLLSRKRCCALSIGWANELLMILHQSQR